MLAFINSQKIDACVILILETKMQVKQLVKRSDMQIFNWKRSFVFNYAFAVAENYVPS